MQFWVIQTLNSLALGGLLFLLAAGFSLIFGLMRIANLTHGAYYMLGAYIGVSILKVIPNLWIAALLGGIAVAVLGGLVERLLPQADGVAAEKGLKAGDVIVEISQEEVNSPADVKKKVDEARERNRKSVLLLVEGQGGLRFVALQIG